MKKFILLLLITGAYEINYAQTYTIETVPNTRLSDRNNHVSNPDHILLPETTDSINRMLSHLEEQTTSEVAVVALSSIGDADIFQFAQDLFNTWGIGKSENNNGLLILLIKDQRTVRFHTGYGLEGMLPDIICKQIQRDYMVPLFKEGNLGGGLRAGVEQVVKILTDSSYANEIRGKAFRHQENIIADEATVQRPAHTIGHGWRVFSFFVLFFGVMIMVVSFFTKEVLKKTTIKKYYETEPLYPEMQMTLSRYVLINIFIPVAILITYFLFPVKTFAHVYFLLAIGYGYFVGKLVYKRFRMKLIMDRLSASGKYSEVVQFLNEYKYHWLKRILFLPVPALFFQIDLFIQRKRYRNHPRNCKSCGHPLQKLDENSDDNYLRQNQLFEEGLHSVNYDVWLCNSCTLTEVHEFKGRVSKYKSCPYCKTKALLKVSLNLVKPPTSVATGLLEQKDECKFCHQTIISPIVVPMFRGSSSLSGSSGGSFSSSSSSSSSSSGGSYGGGSSGGGGASSSW
jgi:uncharacterized protein